MSYLIDEKNLERQFLLADILEPWTMNMLETIQFEKGAKILDVGCGLGNTTFLLQTLFLDLIFF